MDFLTFNSFISIPVLIGFYYMGAVLCPLIMWQCIRWLIRKYPSIEHLYTQGKYLTWTQLPADKKWKMMALFIGMLLMAELFWRMLFEFLIAFMQMHDALVY